MVKNYPTLKKFVPLFFFLFSIIAFSQTQTFTTSGTFTVPAGVTQVTVDAWGGGGRGGSAATFKGNYGGGGGGAYASSVLTVVSGNTYTVTVGLGSTSATAGGDSWFNNITTILAKGGNSVPNDGLIGASGGSDILSIGVIKWPGGYGANPTSSPNKGGGGGSSAGTGAAGNYTSLISNDLGATAPAGGGKGGNGDNNGPGGAGTFPGGGGGGAGSNSFTEVGGAGANGQIIIRWTCPTYSLTSTVAAPVCVNTGAVVTLNGSATSLPKGIYTVTYNQSLPNAITGATKTLTVTTAGTGYFTTNNLTNAGATTITITNLASGSGTPNCISLINTYNTAIVNNVNIWNGSVSTDWNIDGNWCSGVPSLVNDKDVLIPTIPTGGRFPVLSAFTLLTYPEGYVKNIVFESGTTLIIDNNSLFVAGNMTLYGKIDLNNEAQLVQGSGSVLDVASTGSIEIDQQGTGDSFNYNYWSSPVNSNLAAKTYSIGGVLKDGTDPTAIKDITFGAAHTWAEGDVGSIPIRLSTYWMYKLENSKGYAAWTRIGNNISIKVGEGYTMKGSNTTAAVQNYTFVGSPNNGDITLPLTKDNDYLVGNPYPSAIDVWEFIDDNIVDITGPLYFWEHSGGGTHNLAGYQGGYATLTKAGGLPASTIGQVAGVGTALNANKIPRRNIPVGQAFFVVGDIIGGNIKFKNNQRVFEKESDGNSVFMKSSHTKSKTSNTLDDDLRPKFRIGFDAPKISHRQLLLTIDEKATPSFDKGYEAEIYEIFADDFYWVLNSKKYVIQATNNVGLNSEVPIGIQLSKMGVVTVKIDALENVDDDTTIYLKDKVTGESFNMREKPVQLNLVAGKYAERFVLIFKTQKLLAEDVKAEILTPAAAQPIIEGIHVFMNNATGELQIKNNSTEEIVSVALINSLGQTVKTWNSNFNIRTISLPLSTATGVYLVQINTKTGKTVKKISVE